MELNDLRTSIECPCCRGKCRVLAIDGTKIQAARKAAGLGLRETARRMGISPMTLSRIERTDATTEHRGRQFLRALNGG